MARTKSFDEDVVLEQAAELFWDRGYEATSLADLEAHLGLGRQSLYNTFGDKHKLFLKALERYRRAMGDPGFSALNAPHAGLSAIRRFFRWSVDMLTVPGPRRGCMVANTILELGNQDADALVQCNHSRDVLERAFRRALTHARTDGDVRQDLDVDAAATMLVTLNYGLTVLAKTGARARELQASVDVGLAGLT
jgi:TetR/AcrR family transcriptional repressor of nem operon